MNREQLAEALVSALDRSHVAMVLRVAQKVDLANELADLLSDSEERYCEHSGARLDGPGWMLRDILAKKSANAAKPPGTCL